MHVCPISNPSTAPGAVWEEQFQQAGTETHKPAGGSGDGEAGHAGNPAKRRPPGYTSQHVEFLGSVLLHKPRQFSPFREQDSSCLITPDVMALLDLLSERNLPRMRCLSPVFSAVPPAFSLPSRESG